MNYLWSLLFLLASWIERQRQQIQQEKDQAERDLSESDPVVWFDAEFNAGGRVRKHDASGAHETNTD